MRRQVATALGVAMLVSAVAFAPVTALAQARPYRPGDSLRPPGASTPREAPKPRPPKPLRPDPRPDRDAGWHFAVGFGSLAWGQSSPCACAAVSVDVAAGYEAVNGLGVEYKPTLTNTTRQVLDQALNLTYYPRLGSLGSPFGVYGGAGALLGLGAGDRQRSGTSYGYGVRARAALGKRQKTRVFADIGVVTFRQRFSFDDEWWGGRNLRQEHVHSGLRVRVGVVW